jgi:4-diphosphocytidyl-2-C-methyl-D-erythritol kinase
MSLPPTWVFQTPAKLNWYLKLGEKRADGYHEITSVLQAIDVWDTLTLRPLPDSPTATDTPPQSQDTAAVHAQGLRFTCTEPALQRPDNLLVRAYTLFFEWTQLPPLPLHVHLEKGIPVQAGLGGGSSDAAAMLLLLNHLALSPLDTGSLAHMAASLGSDVPFFIHCASGGTGTALAHGRGERVTGLPVTLPRLPLVLVQPRGEGVSTAAAYTTYAQHGTQRKADAGPAPELQTLLEVLPTLRYTTDFGQLVPALWNDFEAVLSPDFPWLDDVFQRLRFVGVQRPLLCGSGAAVAGFLPATYPNRQRLAQTFPARQYRVLWAKTLRGGMQQRLTPTPGDGGDVLEDALPSLPAHIPG